MGVKEERFFADAQNDRGGQNDKSTQVKDCKIGEKLLPGVYFVKVRGYKPTKIIKLR